MEVPKSLWATIWIAICFLPFFLGLLVLGILKGALISPIICLIATVGNSAVVLGLWPAHVIWTWFCVASTKQLGPICKIVLLLLVTIAVALWPVVAIVGTVVASVVYGFFAPLVATFEAVGEGKTSKFTCCILDGTWTSVNRCLTSVRDFADVCFHSYFSLMDDLRHQEPPNGEPCEIRVHHLLGGIMIGLLGILVDVPAITIIAMYKSPFMLFKGWSRLLHDLIGRQGPFLEFVCVLFAGLIILLWPVAVVGAVVASALSSFFMGGYAAVVMYQESSLRMGLYYVISSLSIFDEYSNDVIGMREGSCYPRLQYRKKKMQHLGSILKQNSFQAQKPPLSHSVSFKNVVLEIMPLKLLEHLFMECKQHGQNLVEQGLITSEDIEECLSGIEGAKVLSIGLPAYGLLQAILRSIHANSDGFLLSDNTEMTTMNRPQDKMFDWFFDPFVIIKEQIKAENLSTEEENYFSKLVLLLGDPKRLKGLNSESAVENEQRLTEINAYARRLQGITRSISRYPTMKRRFSSLAKSLSEDLARDIVGCQSTNESSSLRKSRSAIGRLFSQGSIGSSKANRGASPEKIKPDV